MRQYASFQILIQTVCHNEEYLCNLLLFPVVSCQLASILLLNITKQTKKLLVKNRTLVLLLQTTMKGLKFSNY